MELKEKVKASLIESLNEDTYKVEHEGHPDADKIKELSHLKPGKKYCNHITKYHDSAKKAAAMLKKNGFQGVKIYKNWSVMEEVDLDEAKQDWELTPAQIKKKMLADYKKRVGFDKPETKDPKAVVKDGKRIHEGKMSELHADIGDHMDKHIGEYKRAGGAEALMSHAAKASHKIAKLHGIEHKHAEKFVSSYIDSKLDESEELMKQHKKWQDDFMKSAHKKKSDKAWEMVHKDLPGFVTRVAARLSGTKLNKDGKVVEETVLQELKKDIGESVETESLEESIMKKLKRAMDGWSPDKNSSPKELVKRQRGYSDKELENLAGTDTSKPVNHSPAGLQQRVVRQEIERRKKSQ